MRVCFLYELLCTLMAFILGTMGMSEPASSAESNEQWLQKRIMEAKSIEKGSDQESFNLIFTPAEPFPNQPPTRFSLKSCSPIFVTASFGYLGTPMPNKPHSNIKDPAVVSVSRLNLAQPVGLVHLTDKEEWLVKMLDDTRAIKPGISRTTLLKTFAQDGGLQAIPGTRYVHKHCPFVKIDVTFDSAGKYTPAKRPIGSDDEPCVLTVSEPYVDLQICD